MPFFFLACTVGAVMVPLITRKDNTLREDQTDAGLRGIKKLI